MDNLQWAYIGTVLVLFFIIFPLSIYIQFRVKKLFDQGSKIKSKLNVTGYQMAKKMLNDHGIFDVNIKVGTYMQDNYNPTNNTVTLSEEVYNNSSITSLSVAAHEIGHVIQYHKAFSLVRLRTRMLPLVKICNFLIGPLFMIGIFLMFSQSFTAAYTFAALGVFVFFGITVFHLITLPVEVDASRRALNYLKENNYLIGNEINISSKILRNASYTYLMALVTSLAYFIMFILRMLLLSRR
ncbi:zinc metallopeptidase [symbiont of Argiope bruennichi]|uniref:zinc metallopeptidase n=1 Tax=symbiont of Argiope bruennichi TaxID=2810479 RepID=UPI003DA4E881